MSHKVSLQSGLTDLVRRENIKAIEVSYPVLWRNLTGVAGSILEALGLDATGAVTHGCAGSRSVNDTAMTFGLSKFREVFAGSADHT